MGNGKLILQQACSVGRLDFKLIHQFFFADDWRSTYFIMLSLILMLFSEPMMYEISGEIKTSNDESSACNDFDFDELEYDYGETDVQGYME